MEPFTILSALLPILVDAGKSAVNRWLTPDVYKPANVTEYAEMRKTDIEFFTALNNAGGTNVSYPWVEAIIKLQRPTVAAIVLLVWAYAHSTGNIPDTSGIDNFASAIGFYLFGDRTLFYSRKGK